jgi:hypothetical protein
MTVVQFEALRTAYTALLVSLVVGLIAGLFIAKSRYEASLAACAAVCEKRESTP